MDKIWPLVEPWSVLCKEIIVVTTKKQCVNIHRLQKFHSQNKPGPQSTILWRWQPKFRSRRSLAEEFSRMFGSATCDYSAELRQTFGVICGFAFVAFWACRSPLSLTKVTISCWLFINLHTVHYEQLVPRWTIQTHQNGSKTVFGFGKQICLSRSEIIL